MRIKLVINIRNIKLYSKITRTKLKSSFSKAADNFYKKHGIDQFGLTIIQLSEEQQKEYNEMKKKHDYTVDVVSVLYLDGEHEEFNIDEYDVEII